MLRWITARIRRIGLQHRIMLYVTAGLLIFFAIYGFLALQAVQQSTDLVFRERLLVARTIAHEMNAELDQLQAELVDASTFISPSSLANNSSALASRLGMICDHWSASHQLDGTCTILLADPRGRVLWSEPNPPPFQSLSIDSSLNTRISIDVTDPTIIRLIVPLRVQTETTGYVIGVIDRHNIGDTLESALDTGSADYIVELIDRSGQVIASNPPGSPLMSAHLKLVNSLWDAGESGVRTHTLENGGGHVIAFAPLTIFPWGIIVEQKVDDAFLLPRNLIAQFIALGFVALLGGLTLAWATTRTVVRPVNALINASQEIARGNLDHPLDTSGAAEVGMLARSFGEMRARVKESREEIANWNHELEARIQQRTRELGALVESSRALTSTLDLDVLFDILMRQTRAVFPPVQGIALFLVEPPAQWLIVHSSFGFDAAECAQVRFQVGEGIAGQVFANQKAMLLCTTAELETAQANMSSENHAHFQRAVGDRAVQSAMGVPLVSKGARLGVLVLYNFAQPSAFAENDVPVLQALANQAAAAIENARLYAELQQKETIRAQLLEKVIEAQEQEHKRIARELHDEFAQTLTALTINLQSTANNLPPEMNELKQRLAETQALTAQMLGEISHWILELRPTVLDDLGLVPAIRWYAENRFEATKVNVVVEQTGFQRRLPLSIETSLFRIAQEAVTNVVKYARAANVHIRLKNQDGQIGIQVQDDGVGFDVQDALNVKDGIRGLGLLGMRERATLLGGTVMIDSQVGQGTRVQVEVPWMEIA